MRPSTEERMMEEIVGSIEGRSFDRADKPSKIYERGRRCFEPGCGTVLSIYNPGPYCAEHEPKKSPRPVRKAS